MTNDEWMGMGLEDEDEKDHCYGRGWHGSSNRAGLFEAPIFQC